MKHIRAVGWIRCIWVDDYHYTIISKPSVNGVQTNTTGFTHIPVNWFYIIPDPWEVAKVATLPPRAYMRTIRLFGEKMRDRYRRGIFLTRRGV